MFTVYYVISIIDIEQLIPFGLKESNSGLQEWIEENERINRELLQFIHDLYKNGHYKLIDISSQKAGKVNYRRKFILKSKSGYIDIILEQPLTMNIYFSNKKDAMSFLLILKNTLNRTIKQNDIIKDMFIDNIKVETGNDASILTKEKWSIMHYISLEKSIVFTFIALIIVIFFEGIKGSFEFVALRFFGQSYSASLLINTIGAIIIAFMFEPIKEKTEKIVSKYIKK